MKQSMDSCIVDMSSSPSVPQLPSSINLATPPSSEATSEQAGIGLALVLSWPLDGTSLQQGRAQIYRDFHNQQVILLPWCGWVSALQRASLPRLSKHARQGWPDCRQRKERTRPTDKASERDETWTGERARRS